MHANAHTNYLKSQTYQNQDTKHKVSKSEAIDIGKKTESRHSMNRIASKQKLTSNERINSNTNRNEKTEEQKISPQIFFSIEKVNFQIYYLSLL